MSAGYKMARLWVLILTFVLVGCAARPDHTLDREQELAVAPFDQPRENWELLAGSPVLGSDLPGEVLQNLDRILQDKLRARNWKVYAGPEQVKKCVREVSQRKDRSRLSGLQYWTLVGQCLEVDLLLVPHMLQWRERQGGPWGVQEPAMVHFDLFLVDVQNKKLVHRYKFHQQQQALSENLLEIRRFFQRGGRWITAEQLAEEGLQDGLQELQL